MRTVRSARVGRDEPRALTHDHCARHTFCTHLTDAGADVATIRELAGHAGIRTTTIYTSISPHRLEHAIAKRTRQRNGLRSAAGD